MINTIILMGRLTRDVELKKTPSDKSVVNFSMAVERTFGKDKMTDFLDCVAWNSTADFISKYFRKGDMIAVIGQMTTREYTANDGTKKKAYEVLVSQVSFCGGKKEAAEQNAEPQAGTEIPNVNEYVTFENPNEPDLPF